MGEISLEALIGPMERSDVFLALPDRVKDVIRGFVEQIPSILADITDEMVTPETITEAHNICYDYALATDLSGQIARAVLAGKSGGLNQKELRRILQDQMDAYFMDLVEEAKAIETGPVRGMTKEEWIFKGAVGNIQDELDLYNANRLPISRLVEIYPTPFIPQVVITY